MAKKKKRQPHTRGGSQGNNPRRNRPAGGRPRGGPSHRQRGARTPDVADGGDPGPLTPGGGVLELHPHSG